MSQPNTSDLVSTIATQLNIVIVALRLLVEMIQNPDAAPSPSMTPGTCPSRPPASPASPLFRTTTAPHINWAPCDPPELALVLQKTPTPTSTSSAGQRTPLAHPCSPIFAPCHPPSTLLPVAFLPLPFQSPMRPLLPLLLHSLFHPHPFSLPPILPTRLPPLCLLLLYIPILLPPPAPSSPPHHGAPFHLDLANGDRLLLPPPLPAHPLDHTQILLGTMIGVPKMTTFLSLSNATKGFAPAGAISLPRCSVPSPRFEHVGLNFLTYKSWPHPDCHL